MTNEEIYAVALKQAALELNCTVGDLTGSTNKVFVASENEGARKYYKYPIELNIVSYGNCAVASVSERLRPAVEKYLSAYNFVHCFETPNMLVLDDFLRERGLRLCFMAHYFLPDVNLLKERGCGFEVKILRPCDFKNLYTEEWSNALCVERKSLDVLAVGAYDGNKLVGLAGCSADCEDMWQIGVDVLPEYRRRGIASALTVKLALEILKRGKVPFYCAAWSNVKSERNAIKSGFRPAWVELTAKSAEHVDGMNKNIRL
ncbi:MAG: GNAT family N-acetyltransferase [Clostridia bacterium]|nr:GNAT family N-acetyltransferase [Clostridia bacterium]